MTSGVFFHGLTTAARAASPFDLHVLLDELSSSPCHGARIESEKLGHPSVAAASGLQGLEPGVQPSLLLIEQAEE